MSGRQTHRCCQLLLLILLATPALGQENVSVAVSGVDNGVKRNVLSFLNLDRLACDISELRLRNVLGDSDQQLSAALRALGYYQATWKLQRQHVEVKGKPCWQIDIDISAGPPTRFTKIDVSLQGDGRDDPKLQQVVAKLPIKTGDRVHHGHYDEAKKLIHQAALSHGYFDGRFVESRLAVDRIKNSATVALVYDTGERYRFGDITLAQTAIREDAVARYLTIASGEPFDAAKLIQSQNNLINSRYFDQVSVNQQDPDPGNHTVDVDIDLSAKSHYESVIGAGFSTDLGPKLSYQLRNRHFNDKGDTYQLQTQYSPVQSQVGLQFQQPGKDPINEKTLWSIAWQQEDTNTYTSQSYNAEVSRIKVLGSGWVRTASLNLLVEDFDIASASDRAIFLYPGIHFQKSRANNQRYPTRGWRLSAGARTGLENALSNTSFVQGRLGAKVILPLLGGRVISQGSAGSTFVKDFAELPTTLRFFAGGDNSVRGYDYESLGPTNDNGQVLGGKYLLTGSIEYDHRVYKEYSLAAFYDAGNAFDNREFTVQKSVGFGVRWHSPIGTIRADLAFPLAKDGAMRLHLSMGPEL